MKICTHHVTSLNQSDGNISEKSCGAILKFVKNIDSLPPLTQMFFFKNMFQTRPLFHLFSSFQTHIKIFTVNKCEKMSIQYTEPGFELTTFGT